MLYFFKKEDWNYNVAVLDTDDFVIDTDVSMERVIQLYTKCPNLFPQLAVISSEEIEESLYSKYDNDTPCILSAAQDMQSLGKLNFYQLNPFTQGTKAILPKSKLYYSYKDEKLSIAHNGHKVVIQSKDRVYMSITKNTGWGYYVSRPVIFWLCR